jgi:hypothetical protein
MKSQKGKSETADKVSASVKQTLLSEIRSLILSARHQVAQAVNAGLTMLYWEIGRRIRQDIREEKRAAYGKEIVAALGRQLETEFGSVCGGTELPALSWSTRPAVCGNRGSGRNTARSASGGEFPLCTLSVRAVGS